MSESLVSLAALKRHIALLEGHAHARVDRLFALGAAAVDARLGGGLAYGRLHEVFAADPEDGTSAAGFAMMLALRAAEDRRPVLWLRQGNAEAREGHLHAPGLAEMGLDPARLILAVADDAAALLKAAGDSLRCASLGAVVIEPWRAARAIDLTVSRRLALAAEQSGVTALLLRTDAQPGPSAAQTRWCVAAAASLPLPANAPGMPVIDISLLRHRGGPDGLVWRVEWDRDQCSFREAPLSGAVFPVPAGQPDQAHRYSGRHVA
jgi:protein ImuA